MLCAETESWILTAGSGLPLPAATLWVAYDNDALGPPGDAVNAPGAMTAMGLFKSLTRLVFLCVGRRAWQWLAQSRECLASYPDTVPGQE